MLLGSTPKIGAGTFQPTPPLQTAAFFLGAGKQREPVSIHIALAGGGLPIQLARTVFDGASTHAAFPGGDFHSLSIFCEGLHVSTCIALAGDSTASCPVDLLPARFKQLRSYRRQLAILHSWPSRVLLQFTPPLRATATGSSGIAPSQRCFNPRRLSGGDTLVFFLRLLGACEKAQPPHIAACKGIQAFLSSSPPPTGQTSSALSVYSTPSR